MAPGISYTPTPGTTKVAGRHPTGMLSCFYCHQNNGGNNEDGLKNVLGKQTYSRRKIIGPHLWCAEKRCFTS